MTDAEKALAKDVLKFLEGANIKLQGYEDYDVGTRYYVYRGDAAVSIESLFDAQFARPPVKTNGAVQRDAHLVRYLVNTAKRTGQEWVVVERYKTDGVAWRGESSYDRALLRAEDGSTIRIYYKWWSKCWVRGQKVLVHK